MSKKEQKKDSFLKRMASFFLTNYRITILVIILALVSGLYAIATVRRDDTPQINVPFYIVSAPYPGASAADVEEQLVTPIENEIKDLENIKEISSTSSNNFGSVVIEVAAEADFEVVKNDIKSAAEKVLLPENAEDLVFSEAGFNDQPFMYLGLIGKDASPDEVEKDAEKYKADIEDLPGVKKVEILGSRTERVEITLDFEAMKDNNLSAEDVKQAVQGANVDFPGGQIEKEEGVLPIQVKGEFASLDDIRNIEIAQQSPAGFGAPRTVKLDDVADVDFGFEEDDDVRVAGFRNGDEFITGRSLLLGVVKQGNADLIDASEGVQKYLDEKDEGDFSENVYSFIGYNSADSVNQQISDLVSNGLLGSVIILVVLSFFVSPRGSVVAVLTIPMVLLITFAVFSFIGYSFNVITLFALLITLGLLVDNAIVVVESIQHNLEKKMKRKDAVVKAVGDVGPAVFAATLTTVLVFLPLAFLPGITGQFIRYIPIVVIVSIISSFFTAIIITPFFGRMIMKLTKAHQKRIEKRGIHHPFIEGFGNHVGKNLESVWKRIVIFALTFVLLIGSFSLPASGTLKSETWPAQDDADFAAISIEYPTGTKIDQKNEIAQTVVNKVESASEVTAVVPIAFAGPGGDTTGLTLVFDQNKDRKAKEIVDELNAKVNEEVHSVPQGDVEVAVELLAEGPPQSEYDMVVEIYGKDLEALKKAAQMAAEDLAELDEVEKVATTIEENSVKKVAVELDRQKLKDEGANGFVAASTVRSIFSEDTAGTFTGEDKETKDIVIAYQDDVQNSIDDVKAVPVATASGVKNLEELASIEEVEDIESIKHLNTERFIEVNINIKDDVFPQQFQQKLQDEFFTSEKLEEIGVPDGSVNFGGSVSQDQEEFGNLGGSFIIAILLVYIVLVTQFKSFVQPFIILLTVPLAMIMVFPGLLWTGNPISFFAGLGIVALVGIVVNDAIVMIDAVNRYRDEGLSRNEALVEGVKQRFKPILATSITTIAGVLPLALANPFLAALGYALVFGLISSTIFTLYVTPLIYSVLTRKNPKKKKA